jgi:hypothetical protein
LYLPDAVGDPSRQQHDWEPGIAPSGLFWTIPIDPSAIAVSPNSGHARLRGKGVAVSDYHNFFNAISGPDPPRVPSHVSFEVRWSGDGRRQKIRDETFGFTGHYVTGATMVSFTASNDGSDVIYSSDPAGQYNPTVDVGGAGSPAVGHERNGVFFH